MSSLSANLPIWRDEIPGTTYFAYTPGIVGVVALLEGGGYAGQLFDSQGRAMCVPQGGVTPIDAQWCVDGIASVHLERRRKRLFFVDPPIPN